MNNDRKKLSEELDEATLAIITTRLTYQASAAAEAECECCGAAVTGSSYDILRQTERRCQLCRFLGEKKKPFSGGDD